MNHSTTPLAPTVEAVDAWLAQQESANGRVCTDYDMFMADIRTKSGMWRCVTSRIVHNGEVHYWTIRGEGSSNGCRETAIPASRIAAARGHFLGATR